MNEQKGDENSTNVKSRFTRPAVTLFTGIALAVAGAVYANHLQVFSSDIIDGEVKTADIAGSAVTAAKLANGSVTTAKLAGNAVTSAKVQDNSITGADIQESTLTGVDAATLGGIDRHGIVRIGGVSTSSQIGLVDCFPGIDYLAKAISVPWAGSVLVTGSFTAGWGAAFTTPKPIAARIERTAPTLAIGLWQEDHLPASGPGRGNITVSEVFDVPPGESTFALKVCDNNDTTASGEITIWVQLTLVYTSSAAL
jgi:hypothetical protein